jgi:hypothetical protein
MYCLRRNALWLLRPTALFYLCVLGVFARESKKQTGKISLRRQINSTKIRSIHINVGAAFAQYAGQMAGLRSAAKRR